MIAVKLADIPIGLEPRYRYTAELCRDYLTDLPPAFTVAVSEAQIEAELALSEGSVDRAYAEAVCLHR